MSSNGRPVTQTFGYKPTLKDEKAADEGQAPLDKSVMSSPPPLLENRKKKSNPSKSRFPKPNQDGNDVTVSRMPKDEKLARTFPNRSYHHLMTIEQAGPAVIGVDDADHRKRVAIKRVRKPGGSVHQVPPSTCDQIVNIHDMYAENGDVVFVYEQMDVSLRHMTGILQDRPLKAFQIAAICREVSANVDQFGAYHAHGRQVVIGLLHMHEELGLAHGALSCSTILLNLNGRVKVANVGDSFIEKRQLNPDSERNDIRSLGAIMMELMEPTTYILDLQSGKLKDSDKWKNSLGIEDSLAATQSKSLQELKQVNGTVKAGTVKAGTARDGTAKEGTLKDDAVKDGTVKARTGKAGTVKAGTARASTVKAGTVNASTVKAGTAKAGTVKAGTVRAGTVKAGTVRRSQGPLRKSSAAELTDLVLSLLSPLTPGLSLPGATFF
ncbi:MAG: hypothetical protein Q9164_005656 [Protoblastenia rupestris]